MHDATKHGNRSAAVQVSCCTRICCDAQQVGDEMDLQCLAHSSFYASCGQNPLPYWTPAATQLILQAAVSWETMCATAPGQE